MLSRDKVLRLGKRELEILSVVWELGEATVQDVCERLVRPAAYSTILTMMRTLESKGILNHRTVGRTFLYRPLVSRKQVQISKLCELRDALFGGSTPLLLNSMLSHTQMSENERQELRGLLENAAGEEDANA